MRSKTTVLSQPFSDNSENSTNSVSVYTIPLKVISSPAQISSVKIWSELSSTSRISVMILSQPLFAIKVKSNVPVSEKIDPSITISSPSQIDSWTTELKEGKKCTVASSHNSLSKSRQIRYTRESAWLGLSDWYNTEPDCSLYEIEPLLGSSTIAKLELSISAKECVSLIMISIESCPVMQISSSCGESVGKGVQNKGRMRHRW